MKIQDLSRQTGLTADLIRVWERRYGAIHPQRDASNHRVYAAGDLRRLVLLRDAVARGHAISQVARLPDDALEEIERRAAGSSDREVVAALLRDVRDHDVIGLEGRLNDACGRYAMEDFCDRIAAPLLREVGTYWLKDRSLIVKEHLATSAVESVLDAVMTGLSPRRGPLVLLATIARERHAAGAKMAAAVAAQHGFRTLMLSSGSTPDEIADVAERLNACGVGVSVIYQNAEHTLRDLRKRLRVPLWVGGAKAPAGTWTRIGTMREFIAALNTI